MAKLENVNGCPDDELELRKPFLKLKNPLTDEELEEAERLYKEEQERLLAEEQECLIDEEEMQKIRRIENDLDACEYDSEVDYLKTVEESNETKSKGLYFNGKLVTGYPTEINMFCQSLTDGELYLSHYKGSDGFGTLWCLKNEETKKTRIVESKKSLASTNKTRDKELQKIAKERYGIDGQKHLNNAGDFISDNYKKFFPEKQKSTVPRSKKDSYLIGIAEYLDKKFKITIHKLTGRLHIYNKTGGIYKSYNETEFSGFLKNEYGERFLKDEVIKIMGAFSNIKEESEDYIAFKNCLLNLQTLKTREFTSDEFVVFQVPFNWNPEAKSEFFEGKVREILVDDQRFKKFLELNGYNFTKDNPHNLITLLIGPGGNGKTTLMALIKIIFHSSVAAVGLHQFENDFGLQPILGKRINIMPDIKKNFLKDIGMLKAVTGEDETTVNRKYKDPITTKLGCKVIGAGNHLPRIEEDTQALWRRIIIIELTNTFKNPTIKKRLLNDTEGIEWFIYESIQAYKKVKINGKSLQKSASEVRKEYLRLSDPCLYAAEELFEKTNEPEDYVTREEIVKMISDFLKANELNKPKHNGTYYTAIRAMGGEEIDKTINSEHVRSFCYVKPKDLLKDKDTDQLEALALNDDQESQAELDSRTLIENISKEKA